MNRIIIVGNGGTGKSTLGAQLGKKYNIPVTHLDQLGWDAQWTRVPESIFRSRLEEILQKPSWIVEGWSYQSTMSMRFDAADTIIYLAFPVWRAYWGATRRIIQYFFRQNPFDPQDSPRRAVIWLTYKAMWMVYRRYEPEVRQLLATTYAQKKIHVFHSRRELHKFLRENKL